MATVKYKILFIFLFILLLLFLPPISFSQNRIALPGNLVLTKKSALDGYELWEYSYSESGWATTLTGFIYKPSASQKIPGVLISHGKGGAALGFSLSKAKDWFKNYISIMPNYTHAGGSFGGGGPDGGSSENVKRAIKSLDILESQILSQKLGDIVDSSSIFAYGNSMGGFVTIEISSKINGRLRAAAYTASGLVNGYTPGGAAQAKDVTAPFLLLHGTDDGTVDPSASQAWADALASYGKIYKLHWFQGGGHGINSDPATSSQSRDLILDWFNTSPAVTLSPSPPTSPPPTGPDSIGGDANNDNKVDGLDYVIWLNNYNQNVTTGSSSGDFDNNSFVDGLDYVIWLNNYNK